MPEMRHEVRKICQSQRLAQGSPKVYTLKRLSVLVSLAHSVEITHRNGHARDLTILLEEGPIQLNKVR